MKDEIISTDVLYSGLFKVLKATMRLRSGEVVEREMVEAPGGATVLPYDPHRRVALLITETRAPVVHEGEARMFEVIGGAYDGEDGETCARREAMEEAGVRLRELEHVACAWPTPANSTERVDYFLAAYGPDDREGPGGGLEEEQENISVCEVPLDTLKLMLESGQIRDVKTLVLVQALLLRHRDLFS